MNILLNGALGKMGSEIIKASNGLENFNIVCGFDIEEKNIGFPVYNDINKIKEDVDIIIDFSVPIATFKILEYARNNKVPVVIATTGFSKEELEKIEEISKEIPIFRSANMSFKVNLMANILENIAKTMEDTDIEIIETHHNRKIDSPSGTAILLADSINNGLENKKEYTFDRMQKREKRQKNEIGFSSIRGGNIVGEHQVIFFGENDCIEITHRAYSRGLFAEGALKAAEFLMGKVPGLYDMKSMIK